MFYAERVRAGSWQMVLGRCPEDFELLPLALYGEADESVRLHVDSCAECRTRVDQFGAQVSAVHDAAGADSAGEPAARPSPEALPSGADTVKMPAATLDFGASRTDPEPGEPALAPESIGRYRIVGVLDSGGQALVYRAVHPTLPRDVAIKIAHEPSSIDRSLLKGDAVLLALLDHPNLVRVHDLDIHEGRPFVVMEFVRGQNLEQLADQALPSPAQAARWLAVIARALAYVHRCGVVHQDIKPKNILIDEAGNPRLIDFGVARWRNVWSDGEAGPSGGTLAFMAPEQARGETERVGPAADIFGLGAALYYLLVGQPPFKGKTPSEQWRRAARCELDRDALRARKVPRALERIAFKAMAAEPQDRFSSAGSMAAALEAFVKEPRRRAVQAGALLAVAAAAIVWMWRPPAAREANGSGPLYPEPPSSSSHLGNEPSAALAPPSSPLRIESLQVELHRRSPGDPTGLIGVDAAAGRFGQDVRIEARLNLRAYCYLIALNPDGKAQLLYPDKGTVRPSLTSAVDFPPRPDDGFGLTDGTGAQGFVLVASTKPLPPFADWIRMTSGTGTLPWKWADTTSVWRYDGNNFRDSATERGEVRQLADLPVPFADTCRALRSAYLVEAIQAVVFPVKAQSLSH
jgi:serine/threonine protein kinase